MGLLRMPALVAMLLLSSAVSFAAAVTITQNEALTKGDDARLEQKVTYSADGLRIADVLAELSQSTGVVMAAGLDKDDWMVYDRKVIVHVTDMKLVDLMRELAGILRFHWSRGGESGKWTYRLWQDKQQRQEEESMRSSAEDAVARKLRETRENAIADMVNLGSLPNADAAKLKTADPWRYVLCTEPLGRDVADFINSFPEARNAFVQGQSASFPVSSLPRELQDTVGRIAVSYDSLARSIGASEDHSELLARFDRLQVTLNRKLPGNRDDVYSRGLLGSITIGSADESLEVPLFEPRSAMARALGAAIVSLKSGADKNAVAKKLEAELKAAAEESAATGGQPERDITSDPALLARVKLFDEAMSAPLPIVLGALFEKSKLNIISDYFVGPKAAFPAGEQPIGRHLETIRTTYGANWEKAGRVLRFRDTEWFKKRAWEVPQVWIDYWVARGKQNNGLALQDLVQIGCLRDEQIDHTVVVTPELVHLGAGDAARNREILRFYGMLSSEQRTLMSDRQLEAMGLDDAQWDALRKALATRGAAYAGASKGSQSVRLAQSGSDQDITKYTFTVYPGPNEPAVTFEMTKGVAAVGLGDSAFKGKKVIKAQPGSDAQR